MLRCMYGLLIACGLSSSLFALDEEKLSHFADTFWQLDARSSNQMEDVANWLEQHGNTEVIDAVQNDVVRSMIRNYYALYSEIEALDKSYDRSFVKIGWTAVFEDLYDDVTGIDEEDVSKYSDEQVMALLVGSLLDQMVFEHLRFYFVVASQNDSFKKKLDEIEVDGVKDHYTRLVNNWMGRSQRMKFAKSLKYLEALQPKLDADILSGNFAVQSLLMRLQTSLADDMKKRSAFWGRLSGHFQKYLFKLEIRNHDRLSMAEYWVSRVFGNAVGAANVQPILKSIPKADLDYVRENVLMPGDVIVEKTPGAITDTFIPGHWGHVAVHVGRPDQLQGYNLKDGSALLDHPLVKKYLDVLQNTTKTTVEAVRPGVKLEDIAHWRIGDIAVLRAVNYPKELIAEAIVKSLSYVGTKYDFSFDVNTEDRIVCSELPFQAFKGIQFRTAKSAGRYTIGPDDVAVLAGKKGENMPNRPFELIHFIHKIKTEPQESQFELYRELLEKDSRYEEVPVNNLDYSKWQ